MKNSSVPSGHEAVGRRLWETDLSRCLRFVCMNGCLSICLSVFLSVCLEFLDLSFLSIFDQVGSFVYVRTCAACRDLAWVDGMG